MRDPDESVSFPPVVGLAERVRTRWERRGFVVDDFQHVAAECLQDFDALDSLDPAEVGAWVARASELPPQLDRRINFGDPPITLHSDERFVVDAYFWLTRSTSIHDHRFSGAFCVASGRTLQTRFRFELDGAPASGVAVGRLEVLERRVLARGEVVPIETGRSFVHRTSHLEFPTVTLCVRTRVDESSPPQLTYLGDALAVSETYVDIHSRQLAMIPMLAQRSMEDARHYVGSLVRSAPMVRAIKALGHLARLAREVSVALDEAEPLLRDVPVLRPPLADWLEHEVAMRPFTMMRPSAPEDVLLTVLLEEKAPPVEVVRVFEAVFDEDAPARIRSASARLAEEPALAGISEVDAEAFGELLLEPGGETLRQEEPLAQQVVEGLTRRVRAHQVLGRAFSGSR